MYVYICLYKNHMHMVTCAMSQSMIFFSTPPLSCIDTYRPKKKKTEKKKGSGSRCPARLSDSTSSFLYSKRRNS